MPRRRQQSLLRKDATLPEKESILHDRDSANAEASGANEALKKKDESDRIAEKHCLAKLMKIYGNLVT